MKYNITQELENIIVDNGIDECYPEFSKFLKAKKIIENYFCTTNEIKSILIISERETDSLMFLNDLNNDLNSQSLTHVVKLYDLETLMYDFDADYAKDFDVCLTISYRSYKEISHELFLGGIAHVNLYDIFILNGLCFSHDYYDYHCLYYRDSFFKRYPRYKKKQGDYEEFNEYFEIFYNKKMFEEATDNTVKSFYLKRLIFNCVNIRDFVYAYRYLDLYNGGGYNSPVFNAKRCKIQIERLLNKCKELLSQRNDKNDVIAFWIDNIYSGDLRLMPYIQSINDSITFNHSYSGAAITRPELKAVFMGKKWIDDKSYEINHIGYDNSKLLQYLSDKNVPFRYVGFVSDLDELKPSHIFDITPSSKLLWMSLEELINASQRITIMPHLITSTHPPFISSANSGERLTEWINYRLTVHDFDVYAFRQRMESIAYIDELIEFYCALLPKNATKIFMSDHGNMDTIFRHHTIFKVSNPQINGKNTDSRVYSSDRFLDILSQIIEGSFDFKRMEMPKYALIQGMPRYSVRQNFKEISHRAHMFWLGYRGIVTENELYVRYGNGQEFYFDRSLANKFEIKDERLQILRNQAGENPNDIFENTKFQYGKDNLRIFENYFNRNQSFEQRKKEALEELFAKRLKDRRIALRGGGGASFQLLCITIGIKPNIEFIIDENPYCLLSEMGYEIIDMSHIKLKELDAVIYPSNKMNTNENLPISQGCIRINIYDWLKSHHIFCEKNFWDYEIMEADIEI